MRYQNLYDIANAGAGGWRLMVTGLILALSAIISLWLLRSVTVLRSRRTVRVLLGVTVAFGLCFAATGYFFSYRPSQERLTACAGAGVETVEGEVMNLHAIPETSENRARFIVGNVEFECGIGTQGPELLGRFGGPIENGVRVRIRHSGGTICQVDRGSAP